MIIMDAPLVADIRRRDASTPWPQLCQELGPQPMAALNDDIAMMRITFAVDGSYRPLEIYPAAYNEVLDLAIERGLLDPETYRITC